jgi:N6-adenosine-specific RNA methylase IME4
MYGKCFSPMTSRRKGSGRSTGGVLQSQTRKYEHSRKPDEQYELIEACSSGPYLELFARGERNGWVNWGHQADNDYVPTWKTYSYNSAVAAE